MNVAEYSAVKAWELVLKTKKAHSLSALPARSATQTTKNVRDCGVSCSVLVIFQVQNQTTKQKLKYICRFHFAINTYCFLKVSLFLICFCLPGGQVTNLSSYNIWIYLKKNEKGLLNFNKWELLWLGFVFIKRSLSAPMCQYYTELNPDWNIKNTCVAVGGRRTQESETHSSTSKQRNSMGCYWAQFNKRKSDLPLEFSTWYDLRFSNHFSNPWSLAAPLE